MLIDHPPARRRFGAALPPIMVGVAAFMQSFDGNAVTVALPAMARGFGVQPLALNMVITAYLIGATAFLPVCGWAAERFGARAMFLLAIALFALASLACGLAPSLTMLVLARLAQGAAGAFLLPVGRIIILGTTPRQNYVQAMALLTIPVMMGPVLGPPLGGLIVTVASWHWLFLINLPVAALGMLLVRRFVPEVPARPTHPLDWLGLVLLSGSLMAITYGVGLSARRGADTWLVLALVVGGLGAGLVYLAHGRRHPHPIVDFGLFRIRTVAATNIGGLFQRMMVSACPFLLALLFQVGFGLSPLAAGELILAAALGSLCGRSFFVRLLRRWGFRRVLTVNAFFVSASVAVCAWFTPATPHPLIFAILFLQGALRSLQLIGLMTLSYADLDERYLAAASTISSISQQFALSCGIAGSVVVVELTQRLVGHGALDAAAISPAFLILALAALLSLAWIRRLPADAGGTLVASRRGQVAVAMEETA